MKNKKGFTLIELLVVIAIIGILSAIVLASLNSARGKAQDSKIQSQLAQMRGAAEIYFTGNGSKYGGGSAGLAGCTLDDSGASLFYDTESGMQRLASSTPGIICAATDEKWAAAAPLVTDPSKYWCVDSASASYVVLGSSFDYLNIPAFQDLTNPVCPTS